MRHRMRFVLAVMVGFLLFAPSVAGAALIYTGAWDKTIADPTGDATSGMDISSVSIANQDGGLYFQMTLQASASGSNYYRIYYYPDTTGGYPWPTQYFVGYNGDLTATETGGGVSIIDAGFNDARTTLQWKVSGIPANATGYFSWWGFTYNDTTSWEIDFTPKSIGTPIPNSVWLLGSGLIGLIGLRRRMRK